MYFTMDADAVVTSPDCCGLWCGGPATITWRATFLGNRFCQFGFPEITQVGDRSCDIWFPSNLPRDQEARPKASHLSQDPPGPQYAGTMGPSTTSHNDCAGVWPPRPGWLQSSSFLTCPQNQATGPHPDSGFCHPPANTKPVQGGRVTWLWPGLRTLSASSGSVPI